MPLWFSPCNTLIGIPNEFWSSFNILLWDSFQKIQLDPHNIWVLQEPLVGLSGEQVQGRGHVALKMNRNVGLDCKMIEANYIILDTLSPYNIILDRPAINALGKMVSTWYLIVKYMLPNGWVGTIWGGQQSA